MNEAELETSSQMTTDEFTGLVKEGIVLVKFYTSWCSPCKRIEPILRELTGASIVKINVEIHKDITAIHGVRSIPVVFLYKDGAIVESFVGAHTKVFYQKKVDEANDG